MNHKIEPILTALKETPGLLEELMNEIDPELYKKEIIKGKWSIHEHATHMAVGDLHGFQKRLEEFKQNENPVFEPLSGDNFSKNYFLELDLNDSMVEFYKVRQSSIELAYTLNAEDWEKEAKHPEYKRYTPYIMLRHLLMHDHFHMYKIEDMGFGVR